MKKTVKAFFEKLGYKIISKKLVDYPYDMGEDFFKLFDDCKPYTMTSVQRMYSIFQAVKYVVENNIEGDWVETGVWKGGSSMMGAHSFMYYKDPGRTMHLYDTFEGMSVPTEKDVAWTGEDGQVDWEKNQKDDHNEWCYSPIDEVRQNMARTGYPDDKIKLIKGKVEDTIPNVLPSKIAILRLDTDWYESVYHSLQHLYPLVVDKGIVIIDDYGYWKGAREAVDQYLKENNLTPLLTRIDNTGRLFIKV